MLLELHRRSGSPRGTARQASSVRSSRIQRERQRDQMDSASLHRRGGQFSAFVESIFDFPKKERSVVVASKCQYRAELLGAASVTDFTLRANTGTPQRKERNTTIIKTAAATVVAVAATATAADAADADDDAAAAPAPDAAADAPATAVLRHSRLFLWWNQALQCTPPTLHPCNV